MYAIDFENTQGSEKTEVWACGYADIEDKQVSVFTNIADMFMSLSKKNRRRKVVCYTHNLSYDGSLIVSWLMSIGYTYDTGKEYKENIISGLIDGRGLWYVLKFVFYGVKFEIRDSLKILPSSLEKLANDFDTEHKKLTGTIDYYRPAGIPISDIERKYIENDIIVLAELLEKSQEYRLTEYLTIGSNCLSSYKRINTSFKTMFPHFDDELDNELRPAYMGGWCYLNPAYNNVILTNIKGYVYDVNSLYPYVMREFSYPIGNPRIITEDIEEQLSGLYILKFRCSFSLKENGFPFIKSEILGEDYITESILPKELTLCNVDFELFKEQYDIINFTPIKLYKFRAMNGIFNSYIDYWYNIKQNAKSKTERTISKLFLNNLGGKFGSKRFGTVKDIVSRGNKIGFEVKRVHKDGIYLPVAVFMTAYARSYIIHSAIAAGSDFIYSDTDSIHSLKELTIPVSNNLGDFKIEKTFSKARYVHKKTYVLYTEDGYEIKASGATQEVKRNIQEAEAIETIFTHGARFKGKLTKIMVEGGYILESKDFTIK